ncbi:hypothetical protein K1719_034808 [Acacia pycnantha]|nr:hypothetical protein K1719_042975 [Acacia pycnantha]KAI9083276.1 hypothetical protein K1719_034808 [Acacia pycnantha]
MKDEPMKSRSTVHLDFILFSLMQGNIEDAYQGVLCLKQTICPIRASTSSEGTTGRRTSGGRVEGERICRRWKT